MQPDRTGFRRGIYRLLPAALVAGVVVSVFLYGYIDRKVEQRLTSAPHRVLSGIYSSALSVLQGDKITTPSLRNALLERKYTEAPEGVRNPGEFQQQEDRLHFITRSFPSPSGGLINPSDIIFDGRSGKIENRTDPHKQSFTLEPVLVAPLGSGDQRVSRQKRLADLPKHLKDAVIAVEDQRFYSHSGIDIYGIGRAAVANILATRVVQGGSTITQQLAKNILFTSRKSIVRKILEMFAAFSLEQRLSKDQILEMYLNEVYFGQFGSIAVHGVGEASMTFFGKKVESITVSEGALLAGLVRAPSYFSPRKHFKRSIERRDLVLDEMFEQNFIDAAARDAAKAEKPVIGKTSPFQRTAPHLAASLRAELRGDMDVDNAILSGLAVYTGIDSGMQQCAENAVAAGLEQIEKGYPGLKRKKKPLEAALVAIEPFTGLVKAWAGGRDYSKNQFDHAYQGFRQIGSAIKPFLYLTAFDGTLNQYKVATPVNILRDEPVQMKLVTKQTWVPENYDRQFRGDVTVRYALENSLNMPSLYIEERVGVPAFARTVQSFRLSDNPPKVPALALGALDTTLLRVAAAYAGLANGGRYVEPRLFSSAIDSEGALLAGRTMRESTEASEDAVFVLTHVLQGVLDRGTAKGARRMGYTGKAAGKTGTSDEARDAWFAGFTPDLAAAVWVGFDDNTPVGLTGAAAALPVWVNFKKCISSFHEELEFIPPSGVVFVEIDQMTNEVAGEESLPENVIREAFVRGTEPSPVQRRLEPTVEPLPEDVRPESRPFWEGWFE